MDHQDFNSVIFNTTKNSLDTDSKKEISKYISQKQNDPETTKMEHPKKLGQIISQARMTKKLNQKQLSAQLGISSQILSRWESEKEIPNNQEISKIEKVLGVKLPRSKKTKIED